MQPSSPRHGSRSHALRNPLALSVALVAALGHASAADDVPASSAGGLSASTTPLLTLVADADVSSLDPTSQGASLGIERGTPWTLLRIRIRKNLGESAVRADQGDRAFARAILSPHLSAFSFAARYEWRPLSFVGCNEDDCDKANATIHTKWGTGFAGEFEIAESLFTAKQADLTEFERRAVPIAASAGAVLRYEGTMPDGVKFGGSNHLVLALNVGYAFRMIGGDLGEEARLKILGTPTRYLHGAEAGVNLQLGNLVLSPKVTFLSNAEDPDIAGLTGPQLEIGISYLLPFTVLGQTAKEKRKADAEAKEAQDAATLKARNDELERQNQRLQGEVKGLEAAKGKEPPPAP